MDYTLNNYIEIFDVKAFDTREEQIEALRDIGLMRYKTKTIISGPMLECEIYPVWKNVNGMIRSKIRNKSRLVQQRLNKKNAVKRVIRLINVNFDSRHIWITLSYDDAHLPGTEEQAKKEMQNYLRRLKRHIKKHNLEPLKYVYVTEYAEESKGVKKKRVHHHIVMNLEDRDIAENMWKNGGRTQARRLQPDDYGLEGMARYITKDPKGLKRYSCSRNLVKPIVHESFSRFTKRKAEKVAVGLDEPKEVFEKMYKNYLYNSVEIKYSDIVSGCYIYAKLRRMPKRLN